MMLLERWAVAAILALTIPLVSTAGGVSGPQQSGDTQTAQPAKNADDQEAPPVKIGDDPDPPLVKTVEDKADDDQDAPPLQAGEDMDAPPAKAAEPAKTADDQKNQPEKTVENQKPQPTVAAEPAVAPPPATAEQVKQRKFEKDSAQLLHLVQELKAEVEKAGANTLSLAALRKAEEIQKLARDLKEKMREQGQALASKP